MGFEEAQNALNVATRKVEEAREEFRDSQEIPSDTPPFPDEFAALYQISDDLETAQLSIDRRLAENGIDYRLPDRVGELVETRERTFLSSYARQWVKRVEPARISVDKNRLSDGCIEFNIQIQGETADSLRVHRWSNEPETIWFAGDSFELQVNITPSQSSQGEEIFVSQEMAGKRPLALKDGLDRLLDLL